MRFNGAEITIKLLEMRGITHIAGIPGGANLPLYDALSKSSIMHVLSRSEQGAGFIVQGIARTTGKAAICFATAGPGVTNIITAIADAKLDSVPIIAITGQVPYSQVGTDAFQEVDTYGLTVPITKHNFFVRSAAELLTIIPEAFAIAENGRPGPVVIDIPKDVQLQMCEFDEWPDMLNITLKNLTKTNRTIRDVEIKTAANMIQNSKKPIMYIGGGVTGSLAHEAVYELATNNNIPVANTLMGIGGFPSDNDLSLGIIGMHGSKATNLLFKEADLVIALGVRFDDRAIGNTSRFCKNASFIHVDIDPSEINKIKQAHISLVGDVKEIVEAITKQVKKDDRVEWVEEIIKCKESFPIIMPEDKNVYHPLNFIKNISSIADKDSIITTDVGQHQMWAAQIYPVNRPRRFLTSGGLGTMGFGLPAAIGAALSNPLNQIICITGDGSILMNIQELATLVDFDLNVKIFIMNNKHLGLVRQLQEFFYKKNYFATKFISNPDFVQIGKGFGIKGVDLVGVENPDQIIREILNEKGPCIINVPVDFKDNVLPIVPPGSANYEMLEEI